MSEEQRYYVFHCKKCNALLIPRDVSCHNCGAKFAHPVPKMRLSHEAMLELSNEHWHVTAQIATTQPDLVTAPTQALPIDALPADEQSGQKHLVLDAPSTDNPSHKYPDIPATAMFFPVPKRTIWDEFTFLPNTKGKLITTGVLSAFVVIVFVSLGIAGHKANQLDVAGESAANVPQTVRPTPAPSMPAPPQQTRLMPVPGTPGDPQMSSPDQPAQQTDYSNQAAPPATAQQTDYTSQAPAPTQHYYTEFSQAYQDAMTIDGNLQDSLPLSLAMRPNERPGPYSPITYRISDGIRRMENDEEIMQELYANASESDQKMMHLSLPVPDEQGTPEEHVQGYIDHWRQYLSGM